MIYNTRNQSNDTESQKEKRPILMLIFSTVKHHGTKITYVLEYCARKYEEMF